MYFTESTAAGCAGRYTAPSSITARLSRIAWGQAVEGGSAASRPVAREGKSDVVLGCTQRRLRAPGRRLRWEDAATARVGARVSRLRQEKKKYNNGTRPRHTLIDDSARVGSAVATGVRNLAVPHLAASRLSGSQALLRLSGSQASRLAAGQRRRRTLHPTNAGVTGHAPHFATTATLDA